MPIVEFEGQTYDFPEDATQEEMTNALAALPKDEVEQPKEEVKEPHTEQSVIKKDEGVRRNKEGAHIAYNDSKGFPTGGRGHLLTKEEQLEYPKGTPIPDELVKQWFKVDMEEADELLTGILEKKKVHVPDEVFSILLNMTFNMGDANLLEFVDMWAAIEVGDWKEASRQMLIGKDGKSKSKYLKDVGNRAVRLANRMASVESNIPDKVEQQAEE